MKNSSEDFKSNIDYYQRVAHKKLSFSFLNISISSQWAFCGEMKKLKISILLLKNTLHLPPNQVKCDSQNYNDLHDAELSNHFLIENY
jgi:hypothetical protein